MTLTPVTFKELENVTKTAKKLIAMRNMPSERIFI
jgi:hypothetical protein